jgi:hypothetical protein
VAKQRPYALAWESHTFSVACAFHAAWYFTEFMDNLTNIYQLKIKQISVKNSKYSFILFLFWQHVSALQHAIIRPLKTQMYF